MSDGNPVLARLRSLCIALYPLVTNAIHSFIIIVFETYDHMLFLFHGGRSWRHLSGGSVPHACSRMYLCATNHLGPHKVYSPGSIADQLGPEQSFAKLARLVLLRDSG
jgi:hypothetical protein